jgi:hypothetical protein
MNTDAMYEVQMHTLEALAQEMAVFHQHYLIERIVNSPDEPVGRLLPKDQRICRFCGQANNPKKFKSKAHFIPQLLGNPYLLSDFECDDCNALFGKYENDLAYSLGMTRTISAVRGKDKVPHFHSPNDAITARVNDFFGAKSTFISRKDTDVEDFKVDVKTGLTEVFYDKKPYRPLNVYKVLLKIALSIISAEDINYYPKLLAFLRNQAGAVDMSEFAKAYYYTMPPDLRMGKPVAILFRKRESDIKMPAQTLSLYFENFLYVLPIPLYEPDISLGNYHEHIDIPLPPPMYSNAIDPAAAFHRTIKDLSSPDLLRGERGSFSFQVDPSIFKTMSSYDPVTGRTLDVVFDPSTITGIHLVDRGTKIHLPVSGEHTGAQLKTPPKAD